jgi:hypothetical protein
LSQKDVQVALQNVLGIAPYLSRENESRLLATRRMYGVFDL